jgi:hypothetical protein
MNARVLLSSLLVLAATACSHPREPDDTQLATLLRSERATANPATAPLDANAVSCLRAWTGDAALGAGLPPALSGEPGRKACRKQLEAWLADTTRNPAGFTFAEVDAVPVVKRAQALERERSLAALARTPQAVPPALAKRMDAPPRGPATAAPGVDLGVAGADLERAEDLCRQAQQKAAAPDTNPRVASFARFCGNNLRQARASLEAAARAGADPQRMNALAAGARNMANVASNVLALPPKH